MNDKEDGQGHEVNGDHSIAPGAVSGAANDEPGEAIQADGPEGGGELAPPQDQPLPADTGAGAATAAGQNTEATDAIIFVKEVHSEQGAGLNFEVKLANTPELDMKKPAHHFAWWFNNNLDWITRLSHEDFELRTHVMDLEERTKLRLVSADGKTPLDAGGPSIIVEP